MVTKVEYGAAAPLGLLDEAVDVALLVDFTRDELVHLGPRRRLEVRVQTTKRP